MSMTREDAISILSDLRPGCGPKPVYTASEKSEALDLALVALRGPTREMVERMRGEWIITHAPTLAPPPITGDTSDGYHTFNELYHHRAVLFSVICNEHPDIAWKSKKHHDGTMYDGMFIVGVNTPEGQATYHYDIDPYWDSFRVKELEFAPEWDGHTPAEAIRRIGALTPPNEPHMINADKLAKRIAGHSNYHGDSILSAIYCAAEGKENDAPIRPIETLPNEPLTLDELLTMDGEPVYVVFRPDVSEEKPQFWVLVSVDEWNDIYLANKEGWSFNYEKFLGDVEGIYRRPPGRQGEMEDAS